MSENEKSSQSILQTKIHVSGEDYMEVAYGEKEL